MANRTLIRQFSVDDIENDIEQQFQEGLNQWLRDEKREFEVNKIVEGTIRDIRATRGCFYDLGLFLLVIPTAATVSFS